MPEMGPGGKWMIVRDIKADPGGCMAIVDREAYRGPCMAHNPGMPVYSKQEIELLKRFKKSAPVFRGVQRIKRVFPKAIVANVILK